MKYLIQNSSYIALLGGVAAVGMAAPAQAQDVTLNALFMSQSAYSEDNIKEMTDSFEVANPGTTVNIEFVPYEALHDKIIAASGVGDDGYDVVLFDVIWPAEFAERGFLKDVTDLIPAEQNEKIFDGAWTTVEYDGRRFGMPWILDTKYLFYNREMLTNAGIETPPSTWNEVMEQAQVIKDKGITEYPVVWSWSQSEAMIADFTTLVAANGGMFFEGGKPAFQTGGAKAALDYMRASLDEGLTNPSSLEYFEEDVRRVFSNGDAAFALNWTYMNSLVNDPAESKVAGQIGVMPAPGVKGITKASAVNGSMGLGITSNSPHVNESWSFITHLAQRAVQEKYATLSLPIWKESYEEASVIEGQEDLVTAAVASIAVMYPRPLVASYTEVSSILQKHLHGALLGQASTSEALENAAKRIERIR